MFGQFSTLCMEGFKTQSKSKMGFFAFFCFQSFASFAKNFILDVWLSSDGVSASDIWNSVNYKYYHSWPYISHVMWTLPSKILLLRQTSICWGLVFTCLKIIPIKPTWVTWILFERRIKPTKKVQQFIQQRPTVIMQTFFFLFYIIWHHSLNKNWRMLPNPY